MAVVATLAFAAPAMATTRFVSATNPLATDLVDCSDPTLPCATIRHAIVAASPGDEVRVAAGFYPETTVLVDKLVHVDGAAAGLDARGRSTSESEVTHGFNVQASGVLIDGFFLHGDNSSSAGTGVTLSPTESGYTIVNDIITGFQLGVSLGTSGASHTVLRHNDIHDNNAGSSPQVAISAPSGAPDTAIDSNRIANHNLGSINIAAGLNGFSSDLSITGNTISNGGGNVLSYVHGGLITGNTITGSTAEGIAFWAGNTDIDVTGNTISGSLSSALSFDDPGAGGTANPSRGITVVGNNLSNNNADAIFVAPGGLLDAAGTTGAMGLHFNRIVGNGGAGVNDSSGTFIHAENNWWGCNGGPNTAGCASVSGNNVVTSPWLVLSATAERGRILTNGDTNRITAGFSFNSTPAPIDASEFPATSLTFPSATLGTVSPTSTTTSGGVAQTLFTAGGTAGQGNVTASADGQQVTTSNFEVSSQAGPAGTNGTNGTNGQDGATGPQGPAGPQGPQGEQGPAGPSTPASPAQPNPVLVLSNSLRATRQRIVSISISCPSAAGLCDGRLGIGVGNATLGNTAFLVNGGNRAVIRIRGGAKVIRTAIRKKKVTIVVLSRDNAGTAALTTKVVTFRK